MINKNKTQLESFVDYCNAHPEQRFWQALRNWARETKDSKINYILTAEVNNDPATFDIDYVNIKDTFYDEK